MRDTGRITCYRAEWSLGEQPQLPWDQLMTLAQRVVNDDIVRNTYPHLSARVMKLRPVMKHLKGFIGRYSRWPHRVELAWGGRSGIVLMHELAHACVPGGCGHDVAWRECFIFLTWRFLGEETGRRLAAAFINHGALK